MKTSVSFILIALLICLSSTVNKQETEFECKLTSSKMVYELGEIPAVNVSIKNNSPNDIYLIPGLDGSEVKWRKPFCYFTIVNPRKDTVNINNGRCKFMNQLREEDFIKVKEKATFNPYTYPEGQEFTTYYANGNKENFKQPGKYQLTFHYSTNSNDIREFIGMGTTNSNLDSLFKQIPKLELSSNTIEIEIKR